MSAATGAARAAGAGRYKPYPAYKDSGVEWLGEIPAHWEVKPLKALLSRNDAGVWGEDFDDEGVIVLRSTEQTVDGNWKIDDPARRKLSIREASAGRLALDDLVVTKSSGSELHIGKTSIVDERVAGLGCCFSNFMQRLRMAPPNTPRLHWHLLNCPVAREQLVYLSSTTTGLGNLNGSILGAIRVPLAPEAEQRAIATFLDRETARIDALVAKKERLIALLQEQRTALITRAVTKGLDPTVPMKDSGVEWLGGTPAHLDAAEMLRISDATSAGTPAKEERGYWDGEIPWVSPKDMKCRFIDSSEDTITERAVRETGIKQIEPPVVLIVVRGMILAHTFPVAITTAPVTINQDMKALRFRNGVEPIFAAWLFEGVGKGILGAVVEEAAHGTRVIRMDRWRAVVAPVPPRVEQRAIAAFLDRETARTDALVAKVRNAIDRLKELRTALISAAVTGKIDVRG